jgi:hypothetical protein
MEHEPFRFSFPPLFSLETDVVMAIEDRPFSPWRPFPSPLPLSIKGIAELSPILPTRALSHSSHSLARRSSPEFAARRRSPWSSPEFVITGAVEFAGATPSAVRSQAPALLHSAETRRSIPVTRTNPRLKTTQLFCVFYKILFDLIHELYILFVEHV